MKRHFCQIENAWIDFEDECNWCGETEHDPWAPTDDDTRGDYEHDIYRQRELDDADWPTDSK